MSNESSQTPTVTAVPVAPIQAPAPTVKEEFYGGAKDPREASLEAVEEPQQEEEAPKEGEEVKEEEEDKTPLATRFAALAKREKAIIEREKALKADLEKARKFQEAVQDIKNNPIAALESIGMTFEDFANAYLNHGEEKAPLSVEDKLKALEEKLTKKEQEELLAKQRAEEEALQKEQQRIESQINEFKSHLNNMINSSEEFELIQVNSAHDTVFEVIESYYQQTGEMLDPKVAAKHVEDYLFEEASKLMKIKKFQANKEELPSGPSKELKEIKPSTQKVGVEDKAKTLTTKQVLPTSVPSSSHPGESREARLKRAASLLKWN